MPRLSVVITAALVILLLLAVALWTRFSQAAGQERSISFIPALTVATSSPKNVAIIIECTRPDGTTEQIGWASLGNSRNQVSSILAIPAQGVLNVRWAVGKQIAFQNATGVSPIGATFSVFGGVIQTGQNVLFSDDPAEPSSTVGVTTLPITGGSYTLRIDGAMCRVTSSTPSPPPPPPARTAPADQAPPDPTPN